MKKIVLFVSLIILLALPGCQSAKKEPSIEKKLFLNLQEGDLPSLNPYIGIDLRSRCLFLALFEPLMRREANGDLVPAAAKIVEIDKTKTKYTFHLRDLVWSNGEKVTSHHFTDAWKYALTPGTFCVRADLFYPIKNAEKAKKGELDLKEVKIFTPDEKTIIVELEHPTPYFLDLTATSFFAPLYEANNDEPLVFNGPFLIQKRELHKKLVLMKNPDYWDHKAVDLEEIHFSMVKDPMSAYVMYENKAIDLVGDPFSSLPMDLIETLDAEKKLHSKLISRVFYLLLNTSSEPLNVASFRRALSASIDRDLLAKHLFIGELPTKSLLPKTLSRVEETYFTLQDPKALLEKAFEEMGCDQNTCPKVTLTYAELSGQKRLAEFLQNQWQEKLGIQVELECLPWNTHIGNLRRRNYQMGTLHLTTIYQDPMFYFDCFRDKSSLCNYTGWEETKFKERLILADSMIDLKEREQLLFEAEKQLFEESPAIALFTQNLQYLVRDHIDLVVSDLGLYDFKRTKIHVKEK